MEPRPRWTLAAGLAVTLFGCSSESTGPRERESPELREPMPNLAVNTAVKGKKVSVFLKYGPSAPGDRLAKIMSKGAAFANDIRSERIIAVDIAPGSAEQLRREPWVLQSEVDTSRYYLMADVLPRGVNAADAELVHSRGNRGTGVKVAFLDGGVQCTNPDLVGRIKGGYDFVLGNQNYCTTGAPAADNGYVNHGTAVAQIIGGALNGQQFYGVAPEADLYSLRVCSGADDCTVARVNSGLYWARDHGMQVVSASIGNCGEGISTFRLMAMSAVNDAGIPQAWAGGNGSDGMIGSTCKASDPVSGSARVSFAIAVSAFDSRTGVAKSGYQYGPEIDISSPTDVEYVTINGTPSVNPGFGGTSAATPHVAGVLALLVKARFSGVSLLTQRLTSTATDAGPAGKDNVYGYGKLNANAAVANLPSVTAIAGPATPIKTAGTYTLTASVGNGLPPYSVKWDITYSNGVRPNVSTGYGSASYSLVVPEGSYSISVTATPKENAWLRVGNPLIRSFPVCTGGAAPEPLLALSAPGGGDPGPNAVGGCTAPPPL
jgi:subtilisin